MKPFPVAFLAFWPFFSQQVDNGLRPEVILGLIPARPEDHGTVALPDVVDELADVELAEVEVDLVHLVAVTPEVR